MAIEWRWIPLLLLLCVSAGAAPVANTPENRAFNAAAEAFQAGFYDRAEKEFADFAIKFPSSIRLAESVLLRAQSRVQLTNYSGAIELLTSGKSAAGGLADQYAFWTAEATMRSGEVQKAADMFAAIVTNFPGSARALEAIVAEGAARSTLGQWDRVASILGEPGSPYQAALKTSPTNSLVVRGALLLAQAHLSRSQPALAEAALAPITNAPMTPPIEWQLQHILCGVRMKQERFADALVVATNLLRMSTNVSEPAWLPESTAMHAGLLEKVGRTEAAETAFARNLAPGIPETYQRQALLKVAELAAARGRMGDAAQTVEKFLAQQPDSPALDAALFAVGELRLREYAGLVNQGPVPSSASTNLLDQASVALKRFVEKFPASPLFGKAQLNLGWCRWFQANVAESAGSTQLSSNEVAQAQAAFSKALESLPPRSIDRAVAQLKLGDTQLRSGQYTNAIASFRAVVAEFSGDPQARTNFIERALYQVIRASIPAGDRTSATNALAKMLEWYPGGLLAERAVLLGGIEVSKYNPKEAQAIYSGFVKQFPDAEMLPEVQLALARSYEQQGKWTNAIAEYNAWLSKYTNSISLARAEYSRAWANAQAGRETNALAFFTNLIARFPSSEFAPLAQWWVADYYLQTGQFESAERAYRLIYYSTNLPNARTAYEARMMAGRAAFARQSASQAAENFAAVWNDTNCPPELRARALFAYGDTLMTMEPSETNRVANYEEAIRVFSRVCEMFPTNKIAALAWGEKASCLLQWAQASQQYAAASNAFQQVIASPAADGRARAIAKVGMSVVQEKQAEQAPEKSRELLKAALDNCLDVFFGSNKVWHDGEAADPFWIRKSGMEAARLAEVQGEWAQAIKVYQRLQEFLPVLRPRIEKSIARAQEQLAKTSQPVALKNP